MKKEKAIKIALLILKKEQRKYAPEAHIYELNHDQFLKKFYDRYVEIGEVIEILEKEI